MGVGSGRRSFAVALALVLVTSGCRRGRRVSIDPGPGPGPVVEPGDSKATDPAALTPIPSRVAAPPNPSPAAAVLPSVVSVQAKTSRGRRTGSGFVFDRSGHIVTNAHILKGARSVSLVLPDNRTVAATVVGVRDSADLAVLRTPAAGLRPATLGHSAGLHVGDAVVAAGAPLQTSGSVTTGIVSALNREVALSRSGPREHLIQTDAAVTSGNSGGPLVDAAGRVVGVTTAGALPGGGLGFALPIERATGIARDLIG